MKIGVIGYVLNPRSGARAPIDLAYALRKRRHEITFYAFSENYDPDTFKKFQKARIRVRLILKSKLPVIGSIFDFIKLYTFLKKDNPNIVNTHIPLSLFLAPWAAGIPTALSYHGTQFDVLNERFDLKNKNIIIIIVIKVINIIVNATIYLRTAISVRLATVVIGISNYTSDEVKKLYKREAITVYSGNAPSGFTRNVKAQMSNVKNIKLLTVSRITPYKQFEKIIKMVNKMQNVELTIVGSSPQSKYLGFLKNLKKKNTKILINISDGELAEHYQDCDIYVTADKYLFFGMPILEAATFGRPSVAYNYAAASEMIVHGKTGFVAKNDADFKKYLIKLIKDKALRQKMGSSARERALNDFSWEKTAIGYEQVFKKILPSS